MLREQFASMKSEVKDPFVIIDQRVWELHRPQLESSWGDLLPPSRIFTVPSGEASKSMTVLAQLYDFLLESGIRRNTPIFVVGGGVVGDLGGFAAATVLRGVPFIQVPTTLLAMVDSSVGGKTGINHPVGKNLIGAFHQPEKVMVDLDFLTTLPQEEWKSGLGEVIKYAAIQEPILFEAIYRTIEASAPSSMSDWIPIIATCVGIKADIVQQDEKETSVRAWLNFGHTFAHALETALEYKHLRHGEAVYLGMISAAFLSNEFGSTLQVDQLIKFNRHLQLRWPEKALDFDHLIRLMSKDKKNRDQGITFVLLEQWGKPYKKTIHTYNEVVKAMQMASDALK
jgi:3-dehydroquinate synthase